MEVGNTIGKHGWELQGNYPVFNVLVEIYHYVEIIWRILIIPNFCVTYTMVDRYYPGKPGNIHI